MKDKMTRKEFFEKCGLFSIGIPFFNANSWFFKNSSLNPKDKVIIIGAGAAGLTAGYLLNQKGIKVEILEANTMYGGRMKRTNDFADFPIPLGAEWLHVKKSVFKEIVNDKNVEIDIENKPYNYDVDYALINGKKRNLKKLGFTIDQKFINSTWFDFFERYIVPSIKNKIQYNKVVKSIDYSSDKLIIETVDEKYTADKIIITVPVKLLQNNSIQFKPKLPDKKLKAIKNVKVWGGCKAFIEFSEKFYPTVTGFVDVPEKLGHKLYYDASYGQKTSQHILGLFAVGSVAEPYLKLKGEEQLKYILNELDKIFDGKASKNYKKHIFQNWTDEPYAKGAYVHYFESWRTIRTLGKPVANKLYFAGDAYTNGSDWSSVHAAARSAKKVVKKLVG